MPSIKLRTTLSGYRDIGEKPEYAGKILSLIPEGEISFFCEIYTKAKESLWSRCYYVSYIGLNEKEILAHVEYQEKEDKGQLQLTL